MKHTIGNLSFFVGAIYLYIINCVFVCLSTFTIVKYLRYPKVHYVDKKWKKRISHIIRFLTIILIAPSLYFACNLMQERKYTYKIKEFIQHEFNEKGYTIVYEKAQFNSNPKQLELAFLDKKFQPKEIEQLQNALVSYGIDNTTLVIKQDSVDLRSTILKEIDRHSISVNKKDLTIRQLNQRLSNYELANIQLDHDIRILFPQIANYSIGQQQYFTGKDSLVNYKAFVYNTSETIAESGEDKLKKWLSGQFPKDSVVLVER